jgi:hypothetical protein
MINRLRAASLAAMVIGFGSTIAAPARADGGINIGTLTCQVGGGWGLVLGSARPLVCTFAVYGGRFERYVGTVWKFGLDLGYTQNGVMIWTVFAPAFNLVPGALAPGVPPALPSGLASVPVAWSGDPSIRSGFNRSA